MHRVATAWLALVIASCASCAIDDHAFPCTSDAQCGTGGACEAEGYCSRVDLSCAQTGRSFVPSAPASLAGHCVKHCVSAVYTSGNRSCAKRDTDGALWCWGDNANELLGAGSASLRLPQPVPQAAGISIGSIAIGADHACVASDAGNVFCWGTDADGQVSGTPSPTRVTEPVKPTTGALVAVGTRHSCALTSTMELRCWGSNARGQLGADLVIAPTTTSSPVPVVEAAGPVTASTVASGPFHACTLTSGRPKCWGASERGQTGLGSHDVDFNNAESVLGPKQYSPSTIAAGALHGALIDDGIIHTWGDNTRGQLGRTTATDFADTADVVADISTASALALGDRHSCAIHDSDVLSCWGANDEGQLGNDTATTISTPTLVDLSGVVQASAGARHTCALVDHQAFCWGANDAGQLGDGTTQSRAEPRPARVTCE